MGYSDFDIRYRIRIGELERALPGVVCVAGAHKSFEQNVWIVVLWGREGAAASGCTAVRIWGFQGFGGIPIEVSITKHKSCHRLSLPDGTPVVIHRNDDRLLDDIVEVDGIPTTSIRRTLLDLCGKKHRRLERTLDTALFEKKTSLGELSLFYEQEWTKGRRGIAIMRELILDRLGGKLITQSGLEDLYRSIVDDFSLPIPQAQYPMVIPLVGPSRADFAYPEATMWIECDSRMWHEGLFASDLDGLKDLELRKLGWLPLRFTYAQLRWRREHVAEAVLFHYKNRVIKNEQ